MPVLPSRPAAPWTLDHLMAARSRAALGAATTLDTFGRPDDTARMRTTWLLLVIAGCGSAARDRAPASRPEPGSPATTALTAPEHRCLPVVAKACGCVYACGSGEHTGDHWTVTHAFWRDTPLRATLQPWCVDGTCTDVFAAEIVCGGICAPRPADPTCQFDPSGACASAGASVDTR
jgi:hypothetical protein